MPKMKHVSGGRSIDVGPDQVPMYESQGWEVQPPKKKTSAQASPNQATTAAKKE